MRLDLSVLHTRKKKKRKKKKVIRFERRVKAREMEDFEEDFVINFMMGLYLLYI